MEIASLVTHVSQDRTVRLVSSARLRDPVLRKLVDEDALDDLAEIEGATSGRLRAQEVGADHLDRQQGAQIATLSTIHVSEASQRPMRWSGRHCQVGGQPR